MEWAISGLSKGGLPGSSAEREEGVVVDVVDHSGSLGVYRREEGGRNSKYNANISMTMHNMTMSGARCGLTR